MCEKKRNRGGVKSSKLRVLLLSLDSVKHEGAKKKESCGKCGFFILITFLGRISTVAYLIW